jgi:glycosyltransferase involved in cell wall biosynthesis
VVILVENLPVPLDRRAWQEALALRRAGWDVTVISPRGSGDMRRLRDQIDGIEVLRYPQRAARGLGGYLVEYLPSMMFTAAWLLHRRMRGRIDVLHGCNPPDLFWLFGRIVRSEGGRYVFDQHDVGPELATTKWGARGPRAHVLAAITRWLERRSYRTADHVIVPNDSYRDIAITRGEVPPGRVSVIRNAPDVDRYRELASGVTVDPHRVGYVGVMGSQDGLDLLLDAWARVTREADMGDAVLELVGDGEATPALKRQVDRLGIARHVRFHGFRRAAEFVPVIAGCAIGVSPDPPTSFNEVSTMVKVVDYLAMGRGVVAFDLRETRTVAGDAAVIATPATVEALGTALLSVMRDPALSRRLGEAGSARVASIRLDWSLSASALVESYRRLLRR